MEKRNIREGKNYKKKKKYRDKGELEKKMLHYKQWMKVFRNNESKTSNNKHKADAEKQNINEK